MPAAPDRSVLARRLLRAAVGAAVAVAYLLAPVGPAPVDAARAEAPAATTVVGELVQAWAESPMPGAPADEVAAGPLSWVEAADGTSVRVPTEDVAGLPPGATVELTVGAEVPDDEADGYEPAREVLEADVVAPAPAVPRPVSRRLTNEVTIALVAPGGAPRDGVTVQQLAATVDAEVAGFWREQTGGAVSVGVAAGHDWIDTATGCTDPSALWNEVARTVGFVDGPGRHLLVYVSSRAGGCPYALAQVGAAPASGGRLYVQDTLPSVIAHELGHNFGLGHSSARRCDAGVESGSCRTDAYLDLYDVMGASWARFGSLNAPQAARLGALPAAAQVALSTADAGRRVELAPLSGPAGPRALRLTDADGVDYWLEYRPAQGRDAWLGSADNRYRLQPGVLLRRADGLPDTSLLLDATPGGPATGRTDFQAALPVGVPIPVSGGDFTVTVTALGPAATLVVDVAAQPGSAPVPEAQGDPAVPGGVLPGRPAGGSGAAVPAPGQPAPAPQVDQSAEVPVRALAGAASPAGSAHPSGALPAGLTLLALSGALVLLGRGAVRARRSPSAGPASGS